MSPYIPPEITDAIISAMDPFYDAHTLAMCALVCRAWLPRSRVKLFEAIRIRDGRTYNLLVERVVHSETMTPYLTSVNRLQLIHDDSVTLLPLSVAARLFFIEFMGKLPGLRTLYVQSLHFTLQQPSVKWSLLMCQFHTITTLTLRFCRFFSFKDVRRLLAALPLLSTLGIEQLTWPLVSHELHLQMTPRSRTYWPELHKLRIEDLSPQCASTFLEWMTAALGGSPVKVLTLCFSNLPSTASLQDTVDAFVGRIGSSVTNLTVDLADRLPLLGFVAIESLSFTDWHSCRDNWEGVASFLQGVSSNTIRSINFSQIYTLRRHAMPNSNDDTTLFHFDHDTLEELDRVLSGERFGNLREVILRVRRDDEEKEEILCAHARRCLPELLKRKILRLYIRDEPQRLDVN